MHIPKKITFLSQSFLLILWISLLSNSDSYVSVYVFCAALAFYHIIENYKNQTSINQHKGNHAYFSIISVVFSIAVIAANYPLFFLHRDPLYFAPFLNTFLNIANILCTFAGGICVGYHILCSAFQRLPHTSQSTATCRKNPGKAFLFSFLVICIIDLAYLFLLEYPGNLSIDSIDQITQMHTRAYINSHPVWHTWAIQSILSVGYFLFSDINKAVALFSIFQILFCATCFSYAYVTLYQAGIPRWCMGLCFLIYVFSPYNIAFSITMWKDIPFSIALFLWIVSFYRINVQASKHAWIDYGVFILASILTCLMRTNGILVYFLSLICFIPYLWKRSKKLLWIMDIVFVIALILCGPFLTLCNVQSTDFVETLSLPLQQISRTITDGHALSPQDSMLLSQIMDIEEIPELYTGWLSDPIKNEVREHDISYLKEHIKEYVGLWTRLGLKHPASYMCAWIDQTKGYWNSGYLYYQYAETVCQNSFGITEAESSSFLQSIKYELFGFIKHHTIFELFNSIGLHVWVLLLCFLLAHRKKRFECLLCIPCMAVIAGLLIGTPVAYEFRYAYPVFLSLPFILPITFFSECCKKTIQSTDDTFQQIQGSDA